MEEVVAGINENGLNELSLEILTRRDNISEIFEKIDSCMERLQSCYRGEPSKKLTLYAEELHSSFSMAKENIKNYSDDLTALIDKMRTNDRYLSSLFRELTEKTIKQANIEPNILEK